MTTAHRPTFDPARGKEALRGPAYHQRLLPAHTQLKYRQRGQGGDADADASLHDLRADLLAAEAAHYAKTHGGALPAGHIEGAPASETATTAVAGTKRALEDDLEDDAPGDGDDEGGEEAMDAAKRRKILEETRDIDADSDGSNYDSEDESDEDSEAELQREMERIRSERAAKKAKEEEERKREEEDVRMRDIALGNPLLNNKDYTIKRRWDDDVVFKNQARGTEVKKPKEFTNDLLRSDFHKRFMNKYVR